MILVAKILDELEYLIISLDAYGLSALQSYGLGQDSRWFGQEISYEKNMFNFLLYFLTKGCNLPF